MNYSITCILSKSGKPEIRFTRLSGTVRQKVAESIFKIILKYRRIACWRVCNYCLQVHVIFLNLNCSKNVIALFKSNAYKCFSCCVQIGN